MELAELKQKISVGGPYCRIGMGYVASGSGGCSPIAGFDVLGWR